VILHILLVGFQKGYGGKMKVNESSIDRIIRVVAGLALLALGFSGLVTGTLGTVFKILGFVPLLTGLVGFCPIYSLLKFHTNPQE
jgi:hypothetical protein